MTVCIAAACDQGRKVVTATDGLLSLGDITADSMPGKMLWYKDWQFLYAGTPANFGWVIDRIEESGIKDPASLSRSRVQDTVRKAFQGFISRQSSCDALDPFNMTMEEFKKIGLKSFGPEFHTELCQRISQKASSLNEQLLVIGWADSPTSVMLYEIGMQGEWLHTTTGFGSIGSGAPVAQSMLMWLGQSRDLSLAETIFNVACAKFSAEKSEGLDVGPRTTIYVSHRRSHDDDPEQTCGKFISGDDIDILRSLWKKHVKPRIPQEARRDINRIASAMGSLSTGDMIAHIKAVSNFSPKEQSSPESTKVDLSHQQPSPESHEETDES